MNCRCVLSVVGLLLTALSISADTDLQINTKKGPIIGLSVAANPATTNTAFDAFRGIPYGKIPKRFQPAVPPENWTTPFDARTDGLACPQPGGMLPYSEDCLFINVYTPVGASSSRSTTKYPVMVFIHGSGFTIFSSTSQVFGPDYFVPSGVILVTLNYRLGAPGFLTLGSKIAPGNLGLTDSLLALQWVQDEIAGFGGDVNNITLFGQSAGSVMTLMHYISPVSTGLFHRAIGHSGSPVADWALISPSEGAKRAKALAQKMGCNMNQNDTMVLQCLQYADIKYIVGNETLSFSINQMVRGSDLPFVPVLDSQLTADKPFFNDSIANLMSAAMTRAKPLITGFTTDEGILMFASLGGGAYLQTEANIAAFVPDNHQSKGVAAVRERYFNNTPTLNKVEGLVQLYTEFSFAWPSVQVSRYFANLTYGYVFAYQGSWAKTTYGYAEWAEKYKMTGVSHSQDLIYLFYNNITRPSQDSCAANSDNLKVSKQMIQWWTTFAKTGKPDTSDTTSTWRTVNSTGYMLIDATPSFINTTTFEAQYYDFWSSLYSNTNSAGTASFTSINLLMVLVTVFTYNFY